MLDVRKSPELRAAVFAVRRANKEVRLQIAKSTRAEVGSLWAPALASRADEFQSRVLVKGARVKTSNEGFTLTAATSTKALRGGLVPAYQYAGAEWGATPKQMTMRTTSRKGRSYSVTKTIQRQFKSRVKQGRVAMDAASEIGTKAVATWVRVIVETYAENMKGEIV